MKIALRTLLAGLLVAAALTGCENQNINTLEPSGMVVLEGEYQTKMSAPDNGQVWVYDLGDDRTIWNGAVKKGQVLTLDPVNKQLSIDGLACNVKDLGAGHTLKITFDKTN